MTGDEREPEQEAARADSLYQSGEDPKGWDRASMRLQTHPLHGSPDLRSTDLLLPDRFDALRLVGDCAVVGAAFSILAYFPLLLVSLGTPYDLGAWFWRTVGGVGIAGALYVFCRAWFPDTGELDRF